jgi:hypothetical protein
VAEDRLQRTPALICTRYAMSTQEPSEEKPTDTPDLELFHINNDQRAVLVDPQNVDSAWIETTHYTEVQQ